MLRSGSEKLALYLTYMHEARSTGTYMHEARSIGSYVISWSSGYIPLDFPDIEIYLFEKLSKYVIYHCVLRMAKQVQNK